MSERAHIRPAHGHLAPPWYPPPIHPIPPVHGPHTASPAPDPATPSPSPYPIPLIPLATCPRRHGDVWRPQNVRLPYPPRLIKNSFESFKKKKFNKLSFFEKSPREGKARAGRYGGVTPPKAYPQPPNQGYQGFTLGGRARGSRSRPRRPTAAHPTRGSHRVPRGSPHPNRHILLLDTPPHPRV